jgi:putative peptidoglycan lipid II flippase
VTRTRTAATGIAGAAGLIAVTTLVARAAGFARTLVFADSVRTGGVGAVYNSVNALPNVLYEIAAGGILAAVAIPVIAGHLGRGDEPRAHHSASALLTWCLAVLVPLAALLALLAPVLSGWIVDPRIPGGGDAGTLMLRVFAVQIPLYGIGIVLVGLLQAHRRFFAPALAPLLSSLVVITTYLTYGALVDGATDPTAVDRSALQLLAWGTTVGVAALSLPLLVPAWRVGWRWTPTFRFAEGDARRSASLAIAGLVALVAQQLAVVVTLWVSNHDGGAGAVSVYGYIQAVYLLPYAVLAVPVATAAFPTLARGGDAGSVATLARSLRAVLVLSGLGVAVLAAAAPSVQAFFVALDARRGDGRTSAAALAALGDALTAYAPGILGFGAAALLTRAVYVRGRPRVAGVAVAGGWVVAALVPLALLRADAGPTRTLVTLGVSSSAGMTVAAVALGVLVHRAWGSGALGGAVRTVVVVLGGVLVGSGAAALLAPPAGSGLGPSLVSGLVTGAIAALGYAAVVALVDRDTAGQVRARLTRRRESVT